MARCSPWRERARRAGTGAIVDPKLNDPGIPRTFMLELGEHGTCLSLALPCLLDDLQNAATQPEMNEMILLPSTKIRFLRAIAPGALGQLRATTVTGTVTMRR